MPGTSEQRSHERVVRAARLVGVVLLVIALAMVLLRQTGLLPPFTPFGGIAMALNAIALLGLTSGRPGGGRIPAAFGSLVAFVVIAMAVNPEAFPGGLGMGWAASSVVITAAISLLAAAYARRPAQLVALGVGGFVVAAVGAVSLFIRVSGYLDDLGGRGFEAVTYFLAVGALVLGVTMLALGWTDISDTMTIPRWAPLAAAAGGVIGSLLLWRVLALQEEVGITARSAQVATGRATAIEREIASIGRMLRQFASLYDRDDAAAAMALTMLRRDLPAATMIALIDSTGHPSLVLPGESDVNPIAETVPVRAVAVPTGREPVAVLEIPDDTARVVVHAARCRAGACPGGVAAVVDLQRVNQLITGRRTVEWVFDIGPASTRRTTGRFWRSAALTLGEHRWALAAQPTARSLPSLRSGLPEVVLLLGMISTAFLVVAIRLGTAAWANARAVERIRIASVITRATDTIWEWDVPHGTLRRSGELWRHLGYDPGRLQQTLGEWLDLVHPDDRDRVTREFVEVQHGRRAGVDSEYRVRTSTGAWHTMVDRGRVIDLTETGEPRHVMGITADVTASRLAERELRETEALTGIGRIAARVAHEINNPLAGIRSAFLLIKDSVPESHPHFRYVGAIEREVERIASVTRNLYDTYRPDDQDRKTSLSTVAADAAALLGQINRRANVEIEIHLDGVPSEVPLSGALLRQIVYNLVQNAVDASPVGGVVDLIGRVDDDDLVIEVRDQGTGVPDEIRGRIFEPFFTTKPAAVQASGLGLGLTMVERSVAAAGGTIAVSDTPGGGATFTVRLPLTIQGATV